MEKKIAEAFEQLKMDESCAERIQSRFRQRKKCPHRFRYVAVAAACVALLVLLFAAPGTVHALKNTVADIKESIKSLIYPEAAVEEQYVFQDGNIVMEKGEDTEGSGYNAVFYLTGVQPEWLVEREDGLYFVGNGETVEVGSRITPEVPFTYVYTDADGILHYIAVGGTYVKGEDLHGNVGWGEWTRIAEDAEKGPFAGWLGGGATFVNNAQRKWYEAAKEELGLPWSG